MIAATYSEKRGKEEKWGIAQEPKKQENGAKGTAKKKGKALFLLLRLPKKKK
jgi:hypothetical protein